MPNFYCCGFFPSSLHLHSTRELVFPKWQPSKLTWFLLEHIAALSWKNIIPVLLGRVVSLTIQNA